MTEITAENINTLITDDVKQFMKEVKVFENIYFALNSIFFVFDNRRLS